MANSNFNTFTNRPTQMKRIITLSPLARMFHPYTDITPFVDNPKLLLDPAYNEENPYEVMIQGAHETRTFKPGEIYSVDESLSNVYVGIDNSRFTKDFGGTGLVYFEVEPDIIASLDYLKQTKQKLPKEIKQRLDDKLEHFRELSHQRCLKACKDLYNSMIAGRTALTEAGKKPPEPNEKELLFAYILKDAVIAAKKRRAKLAEAFDQATAEIGEDVNSLL